MKKIANLLSDTLSDSNAKSLQNSNKNAEFKLKNIIYLPPDFSNLAAPT